MVLWTVSITLKSTTTGPKLPLTTSLKWTNFNSFDVMVGAKLEGTVFFILRQRSMPLVTFGMREIWKRIWRK